MVDSAANVLLETLRDLLIDEVRFVSRVGDEVKKVEADLTTIHALLMKADADRSRSESPTLKNCMAQLRELASRAENVLEKYAFEVLSKRQGKSLVKKFKRFMGILGEWRSVHEVGNEIRDIRSRLSELATELRSISGGGEGSSNSADQEQRRQLRLRYAHEVDHHFVEMKKDIDFLVSKVKDDSPDSKPLISIYGMGGLGKTTMARNIYNHRDIQGCFRYRAWVCVTQQFQAETTLREIFHQIDGNKPDKDETFDGLVRGLYNILEDKKCLIVIDDIWEADHWDIIKPAFPTKNCKVLLTTRNENIITSHEYYLHQLRFLSEDEGWELLQKIAFPIDGEETQVLQSTLKPFKAIGRQIVQKCGFLPLAISVIGGILRQKRQILVEWEEVSHNMDSYLKHGGEGMKKDIRVEQILDLSFNALPYYLKQCFLYLASFPEDAEIEVEQLYLLWMAEGLISPEEKGNHESLRDVAERYLSELAFRCMVQVKRKELNIPHYKFKSCRLHDLMHDLCSSKAKEVKFIKRVDISQHQQDIPSSIGASMHRIAINVVDGGVTLNGECLHMFKDLRSFFVLGKDDDGPTDCAIMVIFESCKNLRILSLERLSFEDEEIPTRIGKLIHLKYMSLLDSIVKKLPRHICHLPYLQTLDLRVSWRCELEVPNHIWRMKRLRHLFLHKKIKVIGGGKLKLAELKELETLDEIISMTTCIADIITLTNLRRLIATIVEEDEECLSTIVDYMSNHGCPLLQTDLTFKSCNLRDIVEKMSMIRSLLSLEIRRCEIGCSFPSFQNLVFLIIRDCEIEGDVMDVLGKFPMLQVLELKGALGELEAKTEIIFDANSFPQLVYINLSGLKGLRKWEVEKGAMPKLRELSISECRNLEKLPDGVRFISTLERLRCIFMSEESVSRWRRDGGNFTHIPSVYFSESI